MTLRKIKKNNSVRYVNKDNHWHSEQTPQVSKERKKMLPKINLQKRIINSVKT